MTETRPSPEQAETIIALRVELAIASDVVADVVDSETDIRAQLAAERIVERVFQAAERLERVRAEAYFGADGLVQLRGMRNRLSHNYLATDTAILWEVISVDLPRVGLRMSADADDALAVVRESVSELESESDWESTHLGSVDPVDGDAPR